MKIHEAIEWLDTLLRVIGSREYMGLWHYEQALSEIKELLADVPDICVGKWIPCSERLPQGKKEEYWICTDTGYQCQCRWTNVNHIWTGLTTKWHWHIMDIPQYSKVVAWRMLPKPYEVRQEDVSDDY